MTSFHFSLTGKNAVALVFCCCLAACKPVVQLTSTQLLDEPEDRALLEWSAHSSELALSLAELERVEIAPDIGEVEFMGSLIVSPTQTTEYTITGYAYRPTGEERTSQQSVKVYVGPRLLDVAFADPQLAQCVADSDLTHVEQMVYLNCVGYGIADLSGIENLLGLKILNLDQNNITDLSPLSGLVELDTLSLGVNQIVDLSPLAHLDKVSLLVLSGNQISDISALSSMTDLNTLWLDNNEVVDLTALSGLNRISVLMLYNNNVVDVTPVASLVNILLLDVSNNQLTTGVSDLESLINAEVIRLMGNGQVSCLTYLSLAAKLKYVLFDACTFPPTEDEVHVVVKSARS